MNVPRIYYGSNVGGQTKEAFGVDDTLFCFAKHILRDRPIGHPLSPSGGLAQFGAVRVGSTPKVGVWCRRDAIFPKQIVFDAGETTLHFSSVHLG